MDMMLCRYGRAGRRKAGLKVLTFFCIYCGKMPIMLGMKRITILAFACCIAVLLAAPGALAQSLSNQPDGTFRQEGFASWYGSEFDGRPTASGEIFDSSLFTAAHPTLPFGTFLIVTNRSNNRQVSVRVNDRGPFVGNRIVDISRAAAEYLDMLVTGTAPVTIETFQAQGQQVAQSIQAAQPQPSVTQSGWNNSNQAAQPAPSQTQAQQPVVPQVRTTTTTVPLEVPANTPLTVNIFHSPTDPNLPPTVVVTPTTQGETRSGGSAPPSSQPTVLPSQAPQPPSQQQPQQAWPQQQPQQPQSSWQQQPPQPTQSPWPPQTGPITPSAQQPQLIPINPSTQQTPQAWSQQQMQPQAIPVGPGAFAPSTAATPQPSAQMPMQSINADPNKTYRVQVGSFRQPRNAVDAFTRLNAENFQPVYERHEDFFRVVLTGVRGIEVNSVVQRLIAMGFTGAIALVE